MEGESSKRAKNFTEFDRNLLLELVGQYKDVVENKKTDGASVKHKNEVWMKIVDKYNGNCQTGPRNAKQLRYLYDTIKKKAKKSLHDDKRNLYKVGGGTFVPQCDELDHKVAIVLKPQYQPLSNSFDSSSSYFEESNSEQETSVENTNVIAEIIQVAGPIVEIPQEIVDVPGSSAKFLRMPSTVAHIEEDHNITPQSAPTKKRKFESIELLSKRIMERNNLKDKLNAEIQRKKEEILSVEKEVKENQLTATNVDVLIRDAELKLKEKEIEIKEKEIQLKNEELLHARRIHEIELEMKEKDLEMKRWEYATKQDAFKRSHIS